MPQPYQYQYFEKQNEDEILHYDENMRPVRKQRFEATQQERVKDAVRRLREATERAKPK